MEELVQFGQLHVLLVMQATIVIPAREDFILQIFLLYNALSARIFLLKLKKQIQEATSTNFT